jgi:hypothetical protein
MKGSISPCHEPDRVRLWAYALIALAAAANQPAFAQSLNRSGFAPGPTVCHS